MDGRSTSLQFAAQRLLHELTVQRLVQRVYEQRLIGNVERGAYVECMIELALRERHPAWCLTEPWRTWDIEHRRTGARVEVKQSAALQRWDRRACPACGSLTEWGPRRPSPMPTFSIKPTTGYYTVDAATWIATPPQRQADLYVFAWHPEEDPDIADHRRPDQWKFFVVAERSLPQDHKGISFNALTRLADVECCDYDALAAAVVHVLESLQGLKAQQLATGV